MDILQATLLGIIEGATEFLPISSTGHLILAGSLLGIPATDFYKSFEIVIQLGAILAVVVLYFRSLLDIEVLKRIAVAFVPTGVIGLACYHLVKTYLLGNATVVLSALFIGGLILILFELARTERFQYDMPLSAITYKQALIIGLFQSVAIIPGVSRSAATIVGGLLLELPRKTIVEFSFLLAVPTMAAATGLDLLKNYASFSADGAWLIAIGFLVSFAVALLAIKFFLSYVRTHGFLPFGIYRVLVAVLFWLLLIR
jgi:undecaprenyl-diphosphatase